MGILFANGVNMQLASDLGATDTSFAVIAGQGSQCPEIATDSTDHMLLVITDKDGNREIVKIIEHELDSDTFTIGDSTAVPHVASTDGRAYEATFDGYQTALAITASDSHKITNPATAETLNEALAFSAVTASVSEINSALGGNTATAAELSTLHSSGVSNADLVKLHAITASKDEVNVLDADNRAIGDLITETSAGTMGAIAAVAVGNYLKSAGVATLPAWGKLALRDTGVKIGRVIISSSGTTTVSGVGFSPSVVIFLCWHNSAGGVCVGFDDGTTCCYVHDFTNSIAASVFLRYDASNYSEGKISSKNSDGFVINITSFVGVGNGYVYYLALP